MTNAKATVGVLDRIKRQAEKLRVFRFARDLKWAVIAALRDDRGRANAQSQVITLKPVGASRGNVLFFHIIDVFLLEPEEPIPHSHSNYWEIRQMAQTFVDMGYTVDAVYWGNGRFVPTKRYDVCIDVRCQLERIDSLLPAECVRIFHIDVANILFQNFAEAKRLLDVQRRRGVTLIPRRYEVPNRGIEYAHAATMLGNEFTRSTFDFAHKPTYAVPISVPVEYPWQDNKDFDSCRKRFLWFGSGGMVRKGLDLALEAFAAMPDFHLTVCGPVDAEEDFTRTYNRELYETPNIRYMGWVDVAGHDFARVLSNCIGMIYPSCCEGQCGGVISCMHAGVIPVISYETGIDVEDFGLLLPGCSVEEIQTAIRDIAALPEEELRRRSRRTWEVSRDRYTRDNFAQEYRKAIETILRSDLRRLEPAHDSQARRGR